jgi:hypothetical protein
MVPEKDELLLQCLPTIQTVSQEKSNPLGRIRFYFVAKVATSLHLCVCVCMCVCLCACVRVCVCVCVVRGCARVCVCVCRAWMRATCAFVRACLWALDGGGEPVNH